MMRKGYADLDAGQIHYHHKAAPGREPIVFFHQTASSGKMFYRLMDALGGAYDMYAFDSPGFGGSFDPEGMPSMSNYVDWLMAAVDKSGLEQFHVVGHHTGACIGVEAAGRFPDRITSLAMIGPVPLTADEREEFRQHFSTPMKPTPDGAYLSETWEYLRELGADAELDLHHREVVDTLRAYWGRYQIYSSVWDQDFTAFYKEVACPMLIMCATDDVLAPFFDRARQMRPDAMAVDLGGANFEPDLDTDRVAAALKEFLDSLAEA